MPESTRNPVGRQAQAPWLRFGHDGFDLERPGTGQVQVKDRIPFNTGKTVQNERRIGGQTIDEFIEAKQPILFVGFEIVTTPLETDQEAIYEEAVPISTTPWPADLPGPAGTLNGLTRDGCDPGRVGAMPAATHRALLDDMGEFVRQQVSAAPGGGCKVSLTEDDMAADRKGTGPHLPCSPNRSSAGVHAHCGKVAAETGFEKGTGTRVQSRSTPRP